MSAHLLAHQVTDRGHSSATWVAPALVAATVAFNLFLCFVHTHAMRVGAPIVAATQLMIMVAALLHAREEFTLRFLVPGVLFAAYMVFLVLVNPAAPPKIAIDIAIPAIFYALGRRSTDLGRADRLVLWLGLAVLAFGIFEIAMPGLHAQTLNIISYYVDKGGAEAEQAGVTGTSLFVSGMRPEGRTFLAFLGDHRVSSVFLEPVSMGNFVVICCAWAFARWSARPSLAIAILAASLVNAMLADARFAIGSILAIALVCTTPLPRSRGWILALPVMAVLLVLVIAAVSGDGEIDNGLKGRLIGAGLLLSELTSLQWLALVRAPSFTADAGYAYLVTSFGLIPCLLLWGMFAASHRTDGAAARLSAMLAVYLCMSLLISNSAVSIKTAGLAWFLLGVICATQDRVTASGRAAGREGLS